MHSSDSDCIGGMETRVWGCFSGGAMGAWRAWEEHVAGIGLAMHQESAQVDDPVAATAYSLTI